METKIPDEINLKRLEEEYIDLAARGVTMEQFLTYLETDHSELLAAAFKARILTDDQGRRVI